MVVCLCAEHTSTIKDDELMVDYYEYLALRLYFVYRVKRGFHRPANIDEINHRRIKFSRQVVQTCRHRRRDIGAVLAADFTSYFIISRQEKWRF